MSDDVVNLSTLGRLGEVEEISSMGRITISGIISAIKKRVIYTTRHLSLRRLTRR